MGMFTSDRRPVVACDPEKGAKQSFKEECDINSILSRHRSGAMVTHVNANEGRFADVSGISDYRESIERVRSANDFFMGLPALVRARFENDPAFFLDFIADPLNAAELVELGLTPALEEPDTAPEAPGEPRKAPKAPDIPPDVPAAVDED